MQEKIKLTVSENWKNFLGPLLIFAFSKMTVSKNTLVVEMGVRGFRPPRQN